MGVRIAGADEPEPAGVARGSSDEPTWSARVLLEKADMRAELVVPPHQTNRLLQTIIYALCTLGAIAGPTLTLKAAPTLPTWALATMILGQLIVLSLVVVGFRGPRHSRQS